jgi:hypothetical protein
MYIDENKKNKSLQEIKEALPNVSEKYITSRYKAPQNINKSYLYAQMINANLYVLSYNHELFTYSESNGREYNAFTSLSKTFRNNELAFQMTEIDIASCVPQLIDRLYGTSNWKNVYSNLMKNYEIDRISAKVLLNSTLNNHRLTVTTAREVYINSGYNSATADRLASATANQTTGNWFRKVSEMEGDIMNAFISNNFKNDRQIRLHDSVWYDQSFETVCNSIELGIEFNSSVVEKENLTLNLKVDTFKVVLSTPPTSEFVVKQYYEKSKAKQVLRTDNFTFYDRDFLQLNATFNISKPIISKDGIYRNPSDFEFLERLQKLYKISMYLNNNDISHFKSCLSYLKKHIEFNLNYVLAVLPSWNFEQNDALEFVVNRSWTYHGGISLTLSDFNSLYHKERRLFINKQNKIKLKADLIRLSDCVENNRLYHIDKRRYHSARHYEIGNLIDMVHNLIGIKRENTINEFNKHTLNCQAIRESNIHRPISVSKPLKPPINQRYKKKIDIFNKEKPKILSSLNNAVDNLENLQDIDQLFTQPKQEEIMTHKYAPIKPISAQEAFSEPIDYTNSVYANYTARTAILEGKEFFVEFSRYTRISELMWGKLWCNSKGFDDMRFEMENQAKKLYDDHYESTLADSMSA